MTKSKKKNHEPAELSPEEPNETAEEMETAAEPSVTPEQWDELNGRFLRLMAEYDNFRKRSLKEREGAHAYSVSETVQKLLPVYDNLERACQAETQDENYKKGVEMTMSSLEKALESIGVTLIPALRGDAFDPNLHEAMMHIQDPDLGTQQIAAIFQRGFRIGERVIRHAVVQVAN